MSWDRGAIAPPLRDAGKGVFNGFVRYITCAAVCQMLKTLESKGQATVIDFSIVSREQLQIASRSLPDKQVEREHDQHKSKASSLKLVLPVMGTTASRRGGLWLSGLWKMQTSGLQSKLSCAMTPSNANQLCSRKAISMSAST